MKRLSLLLVLLSSCAGQSRADRAELAIEGIRALCEEFEGSIPPDAPPELEGICKGLATGNGEL